MVLEPTLQPLGRPSDVDFKPQGPGVPSRHCHQFPKPRDPSTGHGARKPHILPDELPLATVRRQAQISDRCNQMNRLTSDNCQEFLKRFSDCHDAVMRSFQIVFRYRSQKETKGELTLSLRDSETERNEGWVNLVLELDGITEFALRESAVSYQVIFEMHVAEFEGVLFIDFGGCTEQPRDVDGFRASQFYCASKSVVWRLEPYQD